MPWGLTRWLAPALSRSRPSSAAELLVTHGIARRAQSGIYDLLPLGVRVQQKIETLIRRRLHEAYCSELALSTLVDANLWRKSGRLGSSDEESSSAPSEYLFGSDGSLLTPTGEEQVTALVGPVSYRQLPIRVYQITRKFRNELRPRQGLLRTREFMMKDAYSFDTDNEAASRAYHDLSKAYQEIFDDIGVEWVKVDADSGNMGGSLSHEYHYVTPAGEDALVLCKNCGYAANTEKHGDERDCPKCSQASLDLSHGIEVGHTFFLGTRYTEPLGASVTLPSGQNQAMQMGCYGIGVTRIIGAVTEKLRDDYGLIWPASISPFEAMVVSRTPAISLEIASHMCEDGIDAEFDDRSQQIGHLMRAARQAGWPITVIAGNKFETDGLLEVQARRSGESRTVTQKQLNSTVKELLSTA